MADEDKEKAEKLAAAKKRFEQLKKEQQKKGKKGGAKKKKEGAEKKEDKEEVDSSKEDPAATEGEAEASKESDKPDQESDGEPDAEPERKPSLSAASKQRSESFRAGTSPSATSPGPQGEVQEIYRKQAARIEELEAEVKAAKQQHDSDATRLTKTEEELERLREGSGDLAELKTKASKADQLSTELASVQRQLAQAQQAAKGDKRRASGASSDLAQQLESKTATIESLELDLSNLQNQVKTLQSTIGERETAAEELEQRAKTAEEARASYQKELDALKVSISFPSDESKGEDEPETLKKRITVLESDLRTANSNLEAASQRATSLEQKLGALTKLHKDSTSSSQSKDKEITELRNQLKKRDRPSHVRDASEFELGEEETETGALQAKIRALEAENFDLRRGIWRDKRMELQPGMEDSGAADNYEDVDLNGPYSPLGRKPSSGTPGQQSSSFQDVIASGISAFTGRPRDTQRPSAAHGRKASLGLLDDDDDDIDEEAFRLAQEEEAKKRIERVKEVKRGLENWRGWRVDLADSRQQGIGAGRDCGPVFEI